MSAHDSIVILGAAVIGLDVALVLAERGYGKVITVIAEHLPGDTALSYTSPWSLPGVGDPKCYPTRGQVLLTHAPEAHMNIMRHGKDYETYVIPRPCSNGHVILGGYMQKGNGDGTTFSYETESILKRTNELIDEVRTGTLEVLTAFSGLRPSREGGARVEREDVIVVGQKRTVVHNYGAGGTGFRAGYGMALDAVRAAEPVLSKIQIEPGPKL
ncbi:d-amino-acid oxidase [Fusarium beomiforme]|uniref:D-amino-acid oxidase n=1 Tax=Fusarium beomiforme TaxID=44412 RepID=A0A9P5AAZ1_9HYPO|nr:d-amino-acid oxidase [Fusarium beomiforme]